MTYRSGWTLSLIAVLSAYQGGLLFCQSAFADIFHLAGGKKIDGLLIREDATTVSFEMDGAGLWTLDRQTIKTVEKESPGLYWMRIGERYAEGNQISKAREAFTKAAEDPDTTERAMRRLKDLNLVEPSHGSAILMSFSKLDPTGFHLDDMREQVDQLSFQLEQPQTTPAPPSAPIEPEVKIETASFPFQGVPSISIDPPSPAPDRTKGGNTVHNMIRKYARLYGLDPILVRAVITVESEWNPNCTSSSGAQGLMQLMPATAAKMGVRDAYDPEENIRGGCKYLSLMFKEYESLGSVDQWTNAIAAYHAGPTKLREVGDFHQIPATKRYVHKVANAYQRLHRKKTEEVAYLGGVRASNID
jgi:hypothetical protein